MNFQELVREKCEHKDTVGSGIYEDGAIMAKNAIIDLLMKVNEGNFNEDGEPLHENSHWEIETIRNLIKLIKESKDYE